METGTCSRLFTDLANKYSIFFRKENAYVPFFSLSNSCWFLKHVSDYAQRVAPYGHHSASNAQKIL